MCIDGGCARNKEGVLCGDCADGSYPLGAGCAKCAWTHWSWLLLLLFANYMYVLVIYQTCQNMVTAHDVMLKIFLFFIQTVVVMFTVEELTSELSELLSVFGMSSFIGTQGGSETSACLQNSHRFFLFATLLQPIVSWTQLMMQGLVMFIVHAVQTRKFKGFHTSGCLLGQQIG